MPFHLVLTEGESVSCNCNTPLEVQESFQEGYALGRDQI